MVGAHCVSSFGSAVVAFAFTYLSYTISGSLAVSVLVMALHAVPSPLLIKPATAIAQKYDLRLVLAVFGAAKSALFFAVAFVVWRGGDSLTLLLVTSLASGILGALMFPSRSAHLRAIAPEGQIASLDGLLNSTQALAGIVGALAGGVMLASWGAAALFLVNSVCLLFPVAVLLAAAPVFLDAQARTRTSMGAVLRTVRATDALRRFVIIAIVLELIAWPLLNLLPKMAQDVDASPEAFSFLLAAFYIGSALVEPVLTWRQRTLSLRTIATVALCILTVALLLVAANPLIPAGALRLAAILMVLIPVGLSMSMAGTVATAAIQSGAPESQAAETMAVHGAAVTVLAPIGGLLVATLAGAIGLWGVVAVEAVGIAALALALLTPRIRADLAQVDALGPEVVSEAHAGRILGGHGPTAEHTEIVVDEPSRNIKGPTGA